MKLNRQEKEIVRRKFCAYCIKVLHGEALNYLDELERQRKREVNFSELLQKDLDALYCCDDYDMAENFTVMGRQVPVRDEWICKALKKLPVKKTGNYSDALFPGYDRERNRCLPKIGAEYRALSQR